jgi:6-phosphogluconolactonase
LYVSNRGHDSIAVFAVEENGNLNPVQHAPTGGKSPRHFRLLEDRGLCAVAHEEGSGVSILALGEDGRLTEPLQTLPCDRAVFVGQF